MKTTIISIIMAFALTCLGQSNKPVFVKGTLGIQYNSRVTAGAKDIYNLDLNYSDSAVFRGYITNTPIVVGTFGVNQQASLRYQLDCDVVNPNNPAQRRNIGRLYGLVPISQGGTYDYAAGGLKISILPMGTAQGFDSAYGGTATGKPLHKSKGFLDTLRKEAQSLTRNIGGKSVSISVTNYDKMVFAGHKMAAGPIGIYVDAMVNGQMLYDYDRLAWHFQDVAINYAVTGVLKVDKITGSIRWTEKPRSGTQRDGEYVFDVRVNEPVGEGNAFAAPASEASFFETDTTIPALIGTMKYRDSYTGDKVTTSAVAIELTGNNLTRQQGMNLTKLILLSAIVPLNAE